MGDVSFLLIRDGECIGETTSFRHTNQMKPFTSIAATAVIGTSMFILPPAANANEHHHHRHHHHHQHRNHELRRIHREFRHDVREFNHYQRAYNRDWRHERRIYNHEEFGYPRVIPVYGNGYHQRIQPGFGIQIRL